MAKTALDLTSQERQLYRPLQAIERHRMSETIKLEERWRKARLIAREAAKILYEEYLAEKVVLFGSGAKRSQFTLWSDIDLAAWGIPPQRFYAAVAALTSLGDIPIELVDPENCSTGLRRIIDQDGIKL